MNFKRVIWGYHPKIVDYYIQHQEELIDKYEKKIVDYELLISASDSLIEDAEKKAQEIIESANVKAREIVDKAQLKAENILSFFLENLDSFTDDVLYKISRFNVDEVNGKGVLYHSICQLGGCDFNGEYFSGLRDALLEAAKLSLNGSKPDYHACPSCYAEYMRECV